MTESYKDYVFRALSGILFLFSAIAKLISLDSFEIYVFSFRLLSLSGAFLASRLIIALEMFLGVLLVCNIIPRFAVRASLSLLAAFSAFLSILAFSGSTDSCHCFGDLIELTPSRSLVKNVLMAILLVAGIAGRGGFSIPRPGIMAAAAAIVSLSAIFIISPPDNWRYEDYSRSTTLNREALDEALSDGTLPSELLKSDRVICFYSLKCPYCKLSASKIATMRSMGTFSQAPITAIIGMGKKKRDPGPFFEESRLQYSELFFIPAEPFLRITNGLMPLILVVHDGCIVQKYSYRDIR